MFAQRFMELKFQQAIGMQQLQNNVPPIPNSVTPKHFVEAMLRWIGGRPKHGVNPLVERWPSLKAFVQIHPRMLTLIINYVSTWKGPKQSVTGVFGYLIHMAIHRHWEFVMMMVQLYDSVEHPTNTFLPYVNKKRLLGNALGHKEDLEISGFQNKSLKTSCILF